MESFLVELTNAIQSTVVKTLTERIVQFADAVSKASEGKLTPDQVMKVWNEIHPEVPVAKKDTPSQRTKTDKSQKCQVVKQSGKNKGELCGRNCVLGKSTCTSHTPQESQSVVIPLDEKSPAKKMNAEKKETSIPPLPPVVEQSTESDSKEDISKLTVKELKTRLESANIKFTSKDRKDDLISLLSKHRNEPSVAVEKKKDEKKAEKVAENKKDENKAEKVAEKKKDENKAEKVAEKKKDEEEEVDDEIEEEEVDDEIEEEEVDDEIEEEEEIIECDDE